MRAGVVAFVVHCGASSFLQPTREGLMSKRTCATQYRASTAAVVAVLLAPMLAEAADAPELPCSSAKLLGNVEPVSAGGELTLKTTWINAYTSPIRILTGPQNRYMDVTKAADAAEKEAATKAVSGQPGYRAPQDDFDSKLKTEGNSKAWAVSFATNTKGRLPDNPEKLELLFRQTALYNLYLSYVGVRAVTSTFVGLEPIARGEVAQAAIGAATTVAGNRATGHTLTIMAATAAQRTAEQMESERAKTVAIDATTKAEADVKYGTAKKIYDELKGEYDKAPEGAAKVELKKKLDNSKAAADALKTKLDVAAEAASNSMNMRKAVGEVVKKIKKATDSAIAANSTDVETFIAALKKELQDEPTWDSVAVANCGNPLINYRILSSDRYYFGKDITSNMTRAFFSNGIGVRGLAGDASKEVTTTGLGTIYLGFGIDGPLYSLGARSTDGYASAEIFLSYNWVNRGAINKLLETDSRRRTFNAAGLNLEVALLERVSLKLGYSRAFGELGKEIGQLVMTSVSIKTN